MGNKKDKPKQSDEEYLKEYINSKDYRTDEEGQEESSPKSLGSNAKELEYIALDISELPCSIFYPTGTTIFVKPATVAQIQAFSTVDDTNFYDVYEKVNKLIESCIFIKFPDGTKKPYTNLIDGDRFYLLFVIRELTFQKGNDLYTEIDDIQIPITRDTIEFHEMPEKLKEYYDKISGTFVFETKHGQIEMAPPTLGLQKSFSDYIIKRVQSKKEVDQSFLKIVPYTLPGRTSITEQGITKKLDEYKVMNLELFQFLNQAVNLMVFGPKGVLHTTESGQEVRSENLFPEGVSGIFLQSTAFDDILI